MGACSRQCLQTHSSPMVDRFCKADEYRKSLIHASVKILTENLIRFSLKASFRLTQILQYEIKYSDMMLSLSHFPRSSFFLYLYISCSKMAWSIKHVVAFMSKYCGGSKLGEH